MASDLEEDWNILRRTDIQAQSPVTMSVPEAIERVLHVVATLQKTMKSERKVNPAVLFELTDKGLRCSVQGYPSGLSDKPAKTFASKCHASVTVESATEDAFQKVVKALKKRRSSLDSEVERTERERERFADASHEVSKLIRLLGDFNPAQMNIPGREQEDEPSGKPRRGSRDDSYGYDG